MWTVRVRGGYPLTPAGSVLLSHTHQTEIMDEMFNLTGRIVLMQRICVKEEGMDEAQAKKRRGRRKGGRGE